MSCRLRVDLGILKVNNKGQHTEKYNIYCFSAGHMMISCCNTIQQLAEIWIQFLDGKTPAFVNLGQEQVSHCFLFVFFFVSLCSFSFYVSGAQNAVVNSMVCSLSRNLYFFTFSHQVDVQYTDVSFTRPFSLMETLKISRHLCITM